MKRLSIILIMLLVSVSLFAEERSKDWLEFRKAYLNNPEYPERKQCGVCGIQKDIQVHHVIPFQFRTDLELADSNLVTLCVSKYWGINCHLLVGHGGNFKYENPWVYKDIKVFHVIASPRYLMQNGSTKLDEYSNMVKKSVKEYNNLVNKHRTLLTELAAVPDGIEYNTFKLDLMSQVKSNTRDTPEWENIIQK